jgi:Putative porin
MILFPSSHLIRAVRRGLLALLLGVAFSDRSFADQIATTNTTEGTNEAVTESANSVPPSNAAPAAPDSPSLNIAGPSLRPVTLADGSEAQLPPVQVAASTTSSAPDSSAAASAPAAGGQTSSPESSDDPGRAVSQNAMVNLVDILVKRHILTSDDGTAVIKQAQQEADLARAQAAETRATAERALAQAATPAPASKPATETASASDEDTVHVAYVPEVVKNQIRDEVTEEVLKKDREENLAPVDTTPDWVKRFHVSGDIRTRYEGDFYPDGNDVGSFTNFNAINTGSGFVVGSVFPRFNVDQERNRFRLRARIGAEIDLGQGFTAGLRVGSGSDDSPVSENQTLGLANNGQGGNFGKYQLWLDRGFIRYEFGQQPDKDLSFTVGRFDNPFFHTSMIWSDDLAFDGAMIQAKYQVADGVTPFFVAGGFPVFNTDLNFGTNSNEAGNGYASEDKYLFAVQAGNDWKINKDFDWKVGAAYYYFDNIQGKVSDPILLDADGGDTDDSRPAFAQNGNTYIALRDYEDPSNPTHIGETQYFGLATPFHEFALTSQLDYSGFDPFHLWLVGEFVDNLAFDRNAILNNGSPDFAPGPINNILNPADPSTFVGGNLGWYVRFNLGKVQLEQLWDWNVNLSYRYIESDATVDGFNDSDFGGALAGTNLKGFTLGGNVAFSPSVWASLRWMSADAVDGPSYKSDIIQFDLNAKF